MSATSKDPEVPFIFGEPHRFRKANIGEKALSDKSERYLRKKSGAKTIADVAVSVPA